MTHLAVPDVHEQRPDRLSGGVAVLIAFTTFVTAVAAFLHTDASNQADDRRDEAVQRSLQALSSSQTAQAKAQVELEEFARWAEQRTRSGNALLAGFWADADPVRQGEFVLEAFRWASVAMTTRGQSGIDPDSDFGPDQDPAFPARYFAAAALDSLYLNGLQDAANEEASRLDQRAAAYTAVLAMIAVSLYLFGLTLAVTGRSLRLGFLSVGVGMLGVALLWMAHTVLSPSYDTSDDAAAEFARGVVALATSNDRAAYAAAEAHFTRAIALRPTYSHAYAGRSEAIVGGATPERSTSLSIAPPEALARGRADLQTAVALGFENTSTLGLLGAYAFVQGVQSADVGLLNESIGYSRRAVALDPNDRTFRYILAAAHVAAGRIDEARAAYQEAVSFTIYRGGNPATPRQQPTLEEDDLALALTELEIVAAHAADLERATGRSGLAANIRSMKEQIVGRVTTQSLNPPPASPTVIADVAARVFLAEVQLAATVQNYDAARDRISVQWYHNTPEGHGWVAIPEVSQPLVPTIGADGSWIQLTPYLDRTTPADCLPDGSYRVEIYVNGRLAGEGVATANFGAYDGFVSGDLTIAMCVPGDWHRPDERFPGLIDGFQSPDRLHGAHVIRYSLPGSVLNVTELTEQIQDRAMDDFPDLFPGPVTYNAERGTTHEYFLGHERVAWRWYDYGSGQVWVAGGVSPEGTVLLGMVYGPYSWFETSAPQDIMNSMIYVP